jgi:hypothetical protein
MKKSSLLFALPLFFLAPTSALAFVPCTAACVLEVAAVLWLSRYFGIDDAVTGVWLGGLVTIMVLLLNNFLEKKRVKVFVRLAVALIFYALVFSGLYSYGIIGGAGNTLFQSNSFLLDKIFLSMLIGSIVFFATGVWYEYLKKRNGGHAYFPFQKVVMPLATLSIASVGFYFLAK